MLLADWPKISSAIPCDPSIESRVNRIVAGMTLAQKVGQMTQPEIKHVTAAEVTRYYIGSVLNGGSTWPDGNRYASVKEWLALADSFYDASMATDMEIKVPVVWGTDAVHGHGNAFGATIFPHNIGLGAAHDAALVESIAKAVGRQVRATGIHWAFAPTLAVVENVRWGRTYEGFSQDPALVREFAVAFVRGMQGSFEDDANVLSTAKHFIGDGATRNGTDQGVAHASLAQMINVHAQGYYGALEAGAQTVMASFNSWDDKDGHVNYGKIHGSHRLLTQTLKQKMGFDGFVVSDWNGHAQLLGSFETSGAEAINAGIDMVMVPEQWRAFIENTVAQVQCGVIPMKRIDDAVARIVRVKLRAGLFGKRPSEGVWAGRADALLARELARQAVRQSLVLLKNKDAVLPLPRSSRLLVVGKSANSLQNQTGGWSMGWQGQPNSNTDFPAGETILDGLREALGVANVTFAEDGDTIDPNTFDAVVAVIGETPYAEGRGDIPVSSTLRHSSQYPEDLAVLQQAAAVANPLGKPVVTVFVTGRPRYANDLLNLSDAFVVAWLPGTEGKGVADVLVRGANAQIQYDFLGRLPFAWPLKPCADPYDKQNEALFKVGFGLRYGGHGDHGDLGVLPVDAQSLGCAEEGVWPIFNLIDYPPYVMQVSGEADGWVAHTLGGDPNFVLDIPSSLHVETAQVNTQYDARRVTWQGPAYFAAVAATRQNLLPCLEKQGSLEFDLRVFAEPKAPVFLVMECEDQCRVELDISPVLRGLSLDAKYSIAVPLERFATQGARLDAVSVPFSIFTTESFSAAFSNICLKSKPLSRENFALNEAFEIRVV